MKEACLFGLGERVIYSFFLQHFFVLLLFAVWALPTAAQPGRGKSYRVVAGRECPRGCSASCVIDDL